MAMVKVRLTLYMYREFYIQRQRATSVLSSCHSGGILDIIGNIAYIILSKLRIFLYCVPC